MGDMTWWYFISKYVDFIDSFFFLAKKKFTHLSTLHVVHHGIMPFTSWFGIRFVGGGHTTFCGFLNMGVHIIMYFYYFMSSMGPSVQKSLWWKRYLTTLQLTQFVTFFVHACFPLLFHGALFFLLFANFYIQAYMKKGSRSSKKPEEKTDINANTPLKKD